MIWLTKREKQVMKIGEMKTWLIVLIIITGSLVLEKIAKILDFTFTPIIYRYFNIDTVKNIQIVFGILLCILLFQLYKKRKNDIKRWATVKNERR